MKLLFELSGEHPTLPKSEVLASIDAEGFDYRILESEKRLLILETKAPPDRLGERIALSHNIGRYITSGTLSDLETASKELNLIGSVAIRIRDLRPKPERHDGKEAIDRLGAILAKGREVDLTEPQNEIRVIRGRKYYLSLNMFRIDRSSFERRKAESRPFFSPISLHPRYARAIVNLSRARTGKLFLDPFCGTGGILIEAGLIGAKVIGGDLSERMIQGCKKNLEKFGIQSQLLHSDVGKLRDKLECVHSIATDPPYGRSSSTMRETPASLYERAFQAFAEILENGGYFAIVLPEEKFIELGKGYLILEEVHKQKVHRSLDRYYCVFRKS